MKNNLTKFSASKFLMAMLLLVCPLSLSYAACCAGHGGVASCNKDTGMQMCKDGTASPSCKCPKAKAPKTTTTPATTTTTKPTVKKPAKPTSTKPLTTKPTTSKPVTSTKPATTTTKPASSSESHRGCCSKHGGVAQCNASAGYLICKDGSQSASCACH